MSAPTEMNDADVVIVGGGPAGCSAGVFTARYGLDTLIFDRGRSSIQRCAHLENYLGRPAGLDIETFSALMHDHAEGAGCEIIPALVESVTRDDGGFVVETQEGQCVIAERVVTATRYDGEYLRSLDDDAMFETNEHDGEEHERFNRSYPEMDGTTPIDGLYIASPSEEADRQAIIAAGRGGRVGLTVIEETRRERGYPNDIADHYDWVRKQAELDEEWAPRERWREWFDKRLADDYDLDEDRRAELREAEIDRRLTTYLTDEEVDRRTRRGNDRLLDHVDDNRILEAAREIEADREPSGVNNNS